MTGADLKQRREKLGLRQSDLAKRWEVPQPTIANWESGKYKIQRPQMLDDAMKTVEREYEGK